jgi:hypothetical protein
VLNTFNKIREKNLRYFNFRIEMRNDQGKKNIGFSVTMADSIDKKAIDS